MMMTPLGGLVGNGVPALIVGSGSTAAGMAALALGLLLAAALVIVLGRNGVRP